VASYSRGRNAFIVGLLIAVSIGVFAVLFAVMTSRNVRQRRMDIFISLPAAPGLMRGDAVLLRGVVIGEVRALEFGPTDGVIVRTVLTRDAPLTEHSWARLAPADMFGRQSLVMERGRHDGRPLAPGDTVPGRSPPGLTGRLDQLADQAHRLLGDTTLSLVHGLLGGGSDVTRDIASAARELDSVLQRADRLLDAESKRLDDLLVHTTRLTANLDAVADSSELVRIRENLESASANLARLTARVDSTSTDLQTIIRRMERGEGTIGMALHDPALYENATSAMARLDALIADIRANPKRYVNFSIF
jgi:phospholipid/cholesterol/gamma-HCH transport system substrate-binding protein